jgi:lipopolysaccharide/colanic/teichoic acid biosynthesis glycosyltransferase
MAPSHSANTRVSQPHTYFVLKRALDILGALFGLLILFPVFAIVSLLVRCSSPGPIFHRRRVLAHQDYTSGTPESFDAFKFRTMIPDADAFLELHPELLDEFQRDFKLIEDPRVTRVGHILRRTSIDELPQLLNILRGQMSLVGPRMISPPELAMYGEHAGTLLSVKPGLTGLWQVSGRQNVSYAERVKLDMFYIEHRTLKLDLLILLKTLIVVVRRQGAY